jgi:hypothetical protein
MARLGLQLQIRADLPGPLAHADQPVMTQARVRGAAKANTVVAHDQAKIAGSVIEDDFDRACSRVLHGI